MICANLSAAICALYAWTKLPLCAPSGMIRLSGSVKLRCAVGSGLARAGSPAPVQPDRQELGRRAARQLRKGPQVHPHHHNRCRIESDCTTRYHLLPNWRQALKGGTQPTIHSNEMCSAKMELHHLAPNVKLFLGSYIVRTGSGMRLTMVSFSIGNSPSFRIIVVEEL